MAEWFNLFFTQDAEVVVARSHYKYCIYFLFILLSLNSCMVGPNFHTPPSPNTDQYIQGQKIPQKIQGIPAAKAGGKAQSFHAGMSIPAQWWRMFHSEELNCLIETGLKNNPNVISLKAALKQAQQNYLAQVGNLYPSVTGNFDAERQRFSPSEFGSSSGNGSVFSLYNANVSVAYTLDLFGGIRRQIEAAGAQVDYQQFELEAAQLTLTANIVTTVITIASIRAQIQATNEIINTLQSSLTLTKKQFNLGSASEANVFAQENQLAQISASLPPLQQSLAQNLHLLSILIGELPTEKQLPNFNLASMHLPTDIPLSCPSLLTTQRPDIKASEALIHAASAQIGVATANMFPQITINGNYGVQSNTLGNLFQPQNIVWNITAGVAQPIFKGGTLVAQRRAAIAAFEQAAANYKQTVLQAFQNVADTLRALEHDALSLKEQQLAETTARKSFILTKQQFELGSVNYLNLYTAQQAYQQAKINRIKAQASRYTDTAALFQALGGGWWNRCMPNCG